MNRGAREDGRGRSDLASSSSRTRTTTRSSDDSASAEHRRKLEALFSGSSSSSSSSDSQSETSQVLASASMNRPRVNSERVFASPRRSLGGRPPSERHVRLERLRIAREPEEIQKAADDFLSHHQLPDDLEILYKLLQHPTEKVLRETMGQISSLISQGRISSTLILMDRLGDIAGRAVEDSTKLYVEGLRDQVKKINAARNS